MGDQSTMDSTAGGTEASGYSSQSSLDPAANTKDSGGKKRLLAVAFCLAILAALLVIYLVLSGTSSSSGAHSAGDDDDGDSSNQPPSYAGGNGGSGPGSGGTTPMTPGGHSKPSTKDVETSETTPATAATTTQRPIPPYTLVCTYGPEITASSPFPDDGVCDYTVLEEMPFSSAKELGGPWPAGVQHFVDTAAKYSKTEFVAAFDYKVQKMTDKASHDPSVKDHMHSLFSKRIFHYGYINTDTYRFTKTGMAFLMRILKRLTDYLEDVKTPDRPIYTFMSSTWSQHYDDVAAKSVAEISRTVLMPDMYISKAHLYEDDSKYKECKILPPNLLKMPHMKERHVYFYDLYSALKHASDVDKLRDHGINTAALSVSVGLYGRWYKIKGYAHGAKFSPGDRCYQARIKHKLDSIATVCGATKYDVTKSEDYSCNYVVDHDTVKTFVYDTPTTLNYKLCMSRKNVSTLQYGITAARLEYSDAGNLCGMGKFPMLTAAKKTLMFFKDKYKSPGDYEECLKFQSDGRTAEEGPIREYE